MNKAAFLDVDGVIRHNDRSKQGGNFYTLKYSDVDWIDGAIFAHKMLYHAGYDIYWVTMQNCILEGKITKLECANIFTKMTEHVHNKIGCNCIKGVAICTSTENSDDKIFIKQQETKKIAITNNVDLVTSLGVGDAKSDILAFKRAGVGTNIHIDLPDTSAINDHNVIEADGIAPNLRTAVDWFLQRGHDPNSLFLEHVNKLTGREYIILNDSVRSKCYKILQIFKGRKSSSHYHKNKVEKFTVLRGIVKFTAMRGMRYVEHGDFVEIEQGEKHSFESITDMALILEESSYHEDSDTYRESISCASPKSSGECGRYNAGYNVESVDRLSFLDNLCDTMEAEGIDVPDHILDELGRLKDDE